MKVYTSPSSVGGKGGREEESNFLRDIVRAACTLCAFLLPQGMLPSCFAFMLVSLSEISSVLLPKLTRSRDYHPRCYLFLKRKRCEGSDNSYAFLSFYHANRQTYSIRRRESSRLLHLILCSLPLSATPSTFFAPL
jgi:hypothetical protein